MKIEKISERQIRCTLNKKDLIDRELRLSELAYGTDKAKELFRDMMHQASFELGFETDDIPLMIEAIPVSNECLVLVVTKVDDPDELDTRFSKFTDDANEDYCDADDDVEDENCFDDEVINCFGKIDDLLDDTNNGDDFVPLPSAIGVDEYDITDNNDENVQNTENEKEKKIERVFSFNSMEEVIKACVIIAPHFKGESYLYRDTLASVYYLILSNDCDTPENYNHLCGIVAEYGKTEHTMYATFSHYIEHFDEVIVCNGNAVDILSKM